MALHGGELTSLAGQWSLLGNHITGEAAGDTAGRSVSLSADGTRIAVGASENDGTGPGAGHARVFEMTSPGLWTQVGGDIDGEAAEDRSGFSVSLSADGRRIAIGAILNDGNGNRSGQVRVFEEAGTGWTQVAGDIDGEAATDFSGYSVSLSSDGNTVAIGAHQNDGNGNDAGHVRVYQLSGSNWSPVGNDIDGEAPEDQSGLAVSLSADAGRVAIGAWSNDGNGNLAGHVRIHELTTGGVWTPLGTDVDGEAVEDGSGWSVAISANGSRVAVGATGNDGNGNRSGHVRVFEMSGGNWTRVAGDIDGEAAEDLSGQSVSLSETGHRVAIGAYRNDDAGNNAGHVRVFGLIGGAWTQLGSDIDGEAADDESGWSVSLSRDGRRLAVGALRNDNAGLDAGQASVFEYEVDFAAEVNALVADITALGIPGAPGMINTINNALTRCLNGNQNAAVSQLNAFINQVNARRGSSLTNAQADDLILRARIIIDAISDGTINC
jgi:hypothetical protein